MIIILIFISVAIVSGFFAWLSEKHLWEGTHAIAVVLCCSAIIAVLFSGIEIATEHIAYDANLSKLQAEREALVYRLENNMYLGDAVGKFNGELAAAQAKHNDPWTSWFYGDYHMEVDPIELK